MPHTIRFQFKSLPKKGTKVTISGTDLIIRLDENKAFPHITFHADLVSNNSGLYTLVYMNDVDYHVAVRSGVYYGRQYVNGWQENPDDTTERIMQPDKDVGVSVALDIEQVLQVS